MPFFTQLRLGALAASLAFGAATLLSQPVEAAPAQKPAAAKANKAKAKAKAKPKTRAKPRATPTAKGSAKAAGSATAPGMVAGSAAVAAATAADASAVAQAAALRSAGTPALGSGDVLNATTPADWREPDANDLVLMDIRPAGGPESAPPQQVVMELAPRFAPEHAANIRALVRGGYFDGLAVLRVQDNFVTQWGDPGDPPGAENAKSRALPEAAKAKLPAEFDTALAGLPLTALTENDGWTPLSGFVDGMPVGADPAKTAQGRAWLAHCYGAVGAGRGNEIDSSNGSSLYAVIGHAPRALDLNITVVGRILKGIEHLAALPRGGGAMGFYGPQEARPPLLKARLLADIPAAERPQVRVLRTDTAAWANLLQTRRYRTGWYVQSAGRVDLCSTSVPVRVTAPAAP
jgi:cyclophilin family peptidyl-prolyl cis-trans isomerase